MVWKKWGKVPQHTESGRAGNVGARRKEIRRRKENHQKKRAVTGFSVKLQGTDTGAPSKWGAKMVQKSGSSRPERKQHTNGRKCFATIKKTTRGGGENDKGSSANTSNNPEFLGRSEGNGGRKTSGFLRNLQPTWSRWGRGRGLRIP